jgi:hypothetical protein
LNILGKRWCARVEEKEREIWRLKMGKTIAHPKKTQRCAFCKRWNGNAELEFKHSTTGFSFTTGVFGKCMATNSNQPSTNGNGCKNYEPSVEASRLL